MRCSIVIRSYNEEQHIGRLLTGLSKQRDVDYEIILVDSGSSDSTLSIASHFDVQIIQIRPKEFTFGRSLNLGCEAAQNEFIVIASAHVYPVYSDWLNQLLSPFDDVQVALTYGKQRGNQHTKFSEHQVFKSWFADESKMQQSDPFCNNANAAIRRALWLERAYDETISGLEDIEWATWAIARGFHVAYVPQAEVIHVHQETHAQIANRYKREAMAMKVIQPTARFTTWDFSRFLLGNVLVDLSEAIRQRRLVKELRGILGFRWHQFLGTYQGYNLGGPLTHELRKTFYYPLASNSDRLSAIRDLDPLDYGSQIESTRESQG